MSQLNQSVFEPDFRRQKITHNFWTKFGYFGHSDIPKNTHEKVWFLKPRFLSPEKKKWVSSQQHELLVFYKKSQLRTEKKSGS